MVTNLKQKIVNFQNLKSAREELERQNKALEVECTELKQKSISVEAVSTVNLTLNVTSSDN